jgi:hypothetical protein
VAEDTPSTEALTHGPLSYNLDFCACGWEWPCPSEARRQDAERVRQEAADTLTTCSAIWNGCKCGRPDHIDARHVWMNPLDRGRAVDPAMYPRQEAADTSGLTDRAVALIVGSTQDERGQPPIREAADTSGLREALANTRTHAVSITDYRDGTFTECLDAVAVRAALEGATE